MTLDCIHQYWHCDDLPPEVKASREALRRQNPGCDLRLWSFADAFDFIREHYGETVAELFSRCRLPAMQADFFRYCVLLQRGGIYLDCDAMVHVPFARWIDDSADIVLPITRIWDEERLGLGNGFIASEPGNPLLAFALGQCLYNVSRETENNVARVTGPRTLHCALRFKRDLGIQLIDPRDKFLDNFTLVVGDGSDHWSRRQQHESIFIDTPVQRDWRHWSVELPGSSPCRQDVELGFYYAEVENRLRLGQDTAEPLTRLLQRQEAFDFSPLVELLEDACAADYEQYDQQVRQWRVGLVRPATLRFEQRAQTLAGTIIENGELPAPDSASLETSPGLWCRVCTLLEELGHETLAVEAIRRPLGAIDYDRKIWQLAVSLLYRAGLYRESEACALQLLQRDPDSAYALHYLAQVCEKLGDLQRAFGFAREFAAQSDNPAGHMQLQRIQRKLQRLPDDVQ